MGILISLIRRARGRESRTEAHKEPVQAPPEYTVRYGIAKDQGDRHDMEDFYFSMVQDTKQSARPPWAFFVVCDGHGGKDAARFASQNLMRYFLVSDNLSDNFRAAMSTSFLRADSEFQKEVVTGRLSPSGTTALAAVVVDRRLMVSSLGDCRAILSRDGKAEELAMEHKPDSPTERQRIEAAGGFVDCEGYLNGDLNVSRAIGDFHFPHLKCMEGTGPLIAEPEIVEVEIVDSAEFLVLCSDGAWMQSQTLVNIVMDSLREHNCPETASKAVVEHALRCDMKSDNVTVITICFKRDPPPKRQKMVHSNSRLRINRDQ